MTPIRDLPPDPDPGVAVSIYWTLVPRVRNAPERVRAFPDKWPANDRINNGSAATQTYPGNSEFWPLTPEALRLYDMWIEHGVGALCQPPPPLTA